MKSEHAAFAAHPARRPEYIDICNGSLWHCNHPPAPKEKGGKRVCQIGISNDNDIAVHPAKKIEIEI